MRKKGILDNENAMKLEQLMLRSDSLFIRSNIDLGSISLGQ
jgi:hypothetical protein